MSETKSDKILAKGNARKVEFENGGSLVNFSLKISQLVKSLDWLNEQREGLGHPPTDYLNFTIRDRRDGKDDFGNTHYVLIDLWTPEARSEESAKEPAITDEPPF